MPREFTNKGKKYKKSGRRITRCKKGKRRNMRTFGCRKLSRINFNQKYEKCEKKTRRDRVSGRCTNKSRWLINFRKPKIRQI